MGVDGPKTEVADGDRDVSIHLEANHHRHDDVATAPKLSTAERQDHVKVDRGYLSAPLSAPIRPSSPDTLSNLSTEEYAQLQLERTGSRSGALPPEALYTTRTGWRGRLDQFWVRNKGLAYMLLGQVFGVLMNVTTRLLEIEGNKGKGLHPFQILFARMGITFVLATGYMWYKQTPDFPFGKREVRLLLVARGLCGFCGVFGMYYSLLYLPLADATVITFLAPGLACWACSILIKEPFTRLEKIGGLVSLFGVILIARPTTLFAAMNSGNDAHSASGDANAVSAGNSTTSGGSDASNYENVTPEHRLSAVGIALIGALGSAGVYTVIRWIGKRAHPLITVNYFAGWCFFVSVVMQLVLPDVGFLLPADLKEWGYLFFLGICGFTMQFLLAAGLAYEKSSRATNMTYTQMLFALLFDKLVFGHTPGVTSILGSSLILGSAITIAMQQDPNRAQKASEPGRRSESRSDEESRAGLLGGMQDVETAEDHDRIPLQEVQVRALR